MTEIPLAALGPVFDVDGERVDALARDCIRLQITEDGAGLRTGEGRFLDRAQIEFGSRLEVTFGSANRQHTVFDGYVSALERVLDDGNPPVDVVLADYHIMRTQPTPDLTLTWGRNLLGARLRAEIRDGSRIVTVTGDTSGAPDLGVGSRLILQQVGAMFDGAGYLVTGVTHTFDPQQGFRTRFRAERAPLTRSVERA